jgi:hypothetical protein
MGGNFLSKHIHAVYQVYGGVLNTPEIFNLFSACFSLFSYKDCLRLRFLGLFRILNFMVKVAYLDAQIRGDCHKKGRSPQIELPTSPQDLNYSSRWQHWHRCARILLWVPTVEHQLLPLMILWVLRQKSSKPKGVASLLQSTLHRLTLSPMKLRNNPRSPFLEPLTPSATSPSTRLVSTC